jgi:NAD-dependent deacetylase sirtuin 7
LKNKGEKLRDGSPYNWEEARECVKKTTLIVTLGTSLKVLKHYACLWPKKKSTESAIVSIQWTPKDKVATLKINGYCDQVMKYLIKNLQSNKVEVKVNEYSLKEDPIFKLAVKLKKDELITTSKPFLLDYSQSLQSAKSEVKDEDLKSNVDKSQENKNSEKISSHDSWYTKSFKPRKKPQAKRQQNIISTASNTSSNAIRESSL